MIFKIEVDDFWLDEDKELEPALKSYLVNSVTQKISDSIKKKVEDQVERETKNQVENTLRPKVNALVSEIVSTSLVKSGSSNEQITLEKYVKEMFLNNSSWRTPETQIKELAKKFGDELKQRYDLLFASQLVAKMQENNMLREDVAKQLLAENK